jgi:thiosulfate/3-mercaptopyruvate sulfurtransferase
MLPLLIAFCVGAGEAALLMSPEELAKAPDAYVVDVRPAEAYAKGHIPGAVRVDVNAFSETRDGVRGLLRPLDELKPLLEQAGLHPDKHIVIYSSMEDSDGVRAATRLFWILDYLGYPRVSVLDGGFELWQAENRKVETAAVEPRPVTLPELKPREERRATADEVAVAAKDLGTALVDSRSPEEYKGEKKSDSVSRPGHVPGAENLPASELVEKGRFKSADAIEGLMKEKGLDPGEPAITYCNTGRQASVGYFMLRLMGKDDVAMYDGSMSDWTSDPDRPVETGSEKKDKEWRYDAVVPSEQP